MVRHAGVVVRRPGEVRLEERPLRETLRDGEARVAIGVATVCHTDQYILTGSHPTVRYPIVPGHEMSGIVIEVAPGCDAVAAGDRVAVASQIGCGVCRECRSDHVGYCAEVRELGSSLDGGWQDSIVVPASALYRLPEGMSLAEGALTEPSANAHAAVRRAGITRDDVVMIIGPGAVGLLVLQYARLAAPRRIVLAGLARDRDRLALGRTLGADDVIETDDEASALATIAAVTDGRGADVVLQCADAVGATAFALRAVAPRGRVLIEGFSGTADSVMVRPDRLLLDEIRIEGVRGWRLSDFAAALQHNGGARIRLAPIITSTYALADYREALEHSRQGGQTIKVALAIGDGGATSER